MLSYRRETAPRCRMRCSFRQSGRLELEKIIIIIIIIIIITALHMECRRGLAMRKLSVCPSVHQTRGL